MCANGAVHYNRDGPGFFGIRQGFSVVLRRWVSFAAGIEGTDARITSGLESLDGLRSIVAAEREVLVGSRTVPPSAIRSKSMLVPTYRNNLAPGALGFGCCFTVRFPSRVVCRFRTASTNGGWVLILTGSFWFASLENRLVEIQRAEAAKVTRNPR
jgi:hypothetical protein